MSEQEQYTPPPVWTWDKSDDNRFASINRPIAGPTHDKDLPVGEHAFSTIFLSHPQWCEGYGNA